MSNLEFSSLYQLTMVRFRLFLREPEAIFWIFLFPILLAVGLGIAFRNRPADVLQVGATTPQLTQALIADKGLTAVTMDEAEGTHELATGKILLLAIQREDGVGYKYDDTNPDARTARLLVDRAIQASAGRHDAVHIGNELIHETGARYIDFVVPGLLGMNLMGSAIWGMGLAHAQVAVSRLVPVVSTGHAGHRSGSVPWLCPPGLRSSVSRIAGAVDFAVSDDLAGFFSARAIGFIARQNHGSRVRPDESGDAAHVDSVGRLLFRRSLSSRNSADHARQHAAGHEPRSTASADRNSACLVLRALCRVTAHFPVEIGARVGAIAWRIF
jgi:hypothetical protein